MRLLVTGGLGFIGSNFIRYMLNKYDYEIINFDKVTYCADINNLREFENDNRYHLVIGDLCRKKDIIKILSIYEPTHIVHLAAESHVSNSIEDSEIFIESNVVGTYNLLELSKGYDIERIIVTDSDEVYGPVDGYVKEDALLNPTSPYSASKASASLISHSYYHMFKLPVINVRPSNNYGPYQYPEKVVPIFITNALRELRLPIQGDGSHRRNWLYVEDTCSAIDLLLHKGKNGEIYNIGSKFECSIKDLAVIILGRLNLPRSFITFSEERLSDDYRYGIDTTKIENLGWKEEYYFAKGIGETIEWYRNNVNWWESKVMQYASNFKYYNAENQGEKTNS